MRVPGAALVLILVVIVERPAVGGLFVISADVRSASLLGLHPISMAMTPSNATVLRTSIVKKRSFPLFRLVCGRNGSYGVFPGTQSLDYAPTSPILGQSFPFLSGRGNVS